MAGKSTVFLKDCMADAMVELLKTKPLRRITADELVKKAGAGRATYFRSFHSREEVLCYKLVTLWERFCEERSLTERSRFDLRNACAFFEYNYRIRYVLDVIYAAEEEDAVFEAVKTIMLPEPDGDAGAWYRERFYAYGLFGLLDGWIRRGYAESPGEMAALCTRMLGGGT